MQKLDPSVYAEVFQRHPLGEKVFQELCFRFYDIKSYTRDEPYHTAFNEGGREVLAFIINQINHAKLPPEQGEENGEI